MAKFYGNIGYFSTIEEPENSGIWVEKIVERQYYGDFVRIARNLQSENKVNGDININQSISIVADEYAFENFANIKYVEFGGNKWKVSYVEVNHPRLTLTVGGLYNDQIGV